MQHRLREVYGGGDTDRGKVERRRTASQIKPVLMGNSRTSVFEPV